MATNLNPKDEGKRVRDQDEAQIGTVKEVSDGVAYIDPSPSLKEKTKSKLGWADRDEDDYELEPDQIVDVTENEVRVDF